VAIDERKSTMMSCCSKTICNGCNNIANQMCEMEGGGAGAKMPILYRAEVVGDCEMMMVEMR